MVTLVICTLSGVSRATRSRRDWRESLPAIVAYQLGDFLLEDEESPCEAGRHNDEPKGQGEPQMELPKEFAYSHNSAI